MKEKIEIGEDFARITLDDGGVLYYGPDSIVESHDEDKDGEWCFEAVYEGTLLGKVSTTEIRDFRPGTKGPLSHLIAGFSLSLLLANELD